MDFQLPIGKPIDIAKALGGYTPAFADIRSEKYETPAGDIEFCLSKESRGFATRKSGEAIRNTVLNLKTDSKSKIILDFDGVPVVSSSFADELIGKLVIKYGFFGFQNEFQMKNMSKTVQSLVHIAVARRMTEDTGNDNTRA